MTAKKSPFLGMKLSEQVEPPRDQRLFQNSARQSANQPESQLANQPDSQQATTTASSPATPPTSQPTNQPLAEQSDAIASPPANQLESQQVSKPTGQRAETLASSPANQLTSQTVSKLKSQRQSFPKRTYHLSEATVTQLEDMQMALKRKYGIKRPLMEEIVELAITSIYEDFEEKQLTSKLVSKLRS